jgi:hypothetical protein
VKYQYLSPLKRNLSNGLKAENKAAIESVRRRRLAARLGEKMRKWLWQNRRSEICGGNENIVMVFVVMYRKCQ